MRLYLKYWIKIVKWLRGMGYLKEPKRSFLYNGKHYPYYKPKGRGTPSGKLYIKTHELVNSVSFAKRIDRYNRSLLRAEMLKKGTSK